MRKAEKTCYNRQKTTRRFNWKHTFAAVSESRRKTDVGAPYGVFDKRNTKTFAINKKLIFYC